MSDQDDPGFPEPRAVPVQFNSTAPRGRGAGSNPPNRYDTLIREAFDDGWTSNEATPGLETTLAVDKSRRVISYNDSPDVPFDRSVNPYRGCEHGCVYCYARPGHAWMGHSPGLDFESRLYYKPDAVDCLQRELTASTYRCAPMAVGGVTDAYQPVERKLELTRGILQLLDACRHPLAVVTKSALIERDLDLLKAMSARCQVRVFVSLTTLDRKLARRLEPRAAAPHRRLQTIQTLSRSGVPVGVLIAPVIPVLTDAELESLMTAARDAGATDARYILLRLPGEVAGLFSQWLETHAPLQADRVLNRIRDTRGGKLYRAEFTNRMSGSGPYAEIVAQRFSLAWKRLGFKAFEALDCSGFVKPGAKTVQLQLF